ncbi:unnamed protein product [Adineta steineri]|nr:unnamed protein product [Adineta steineri]
MTVIVFFDGLILNVIYLRPNNECPDDGDMDCYSTSVLKVGVTGLTYAVAAGILVIILAMHFLVWTWRKNKMLMNRRKEPSRNTVAPKASEMTVFTTGKQQPSTEIDEERWANPV